MINLFRRIRVGSQVLQAVSRYQHRQRGITESHRTVIARVRNATGGTSTAEAARVLPGTRNNPSAGAAAFVCCAAAQLCVPPARVCLPPLAPEHGATSGRRASHATRHLTLHQAELHREPAQAAQAETDGILIRLSSDPTGRIRTSRITGFQRPGTTAPG